MSQSGGVLTTFGLPGPREFSRQRGDVNLLAAANGDKQFVRYVANRAAGSSISELKEGLVRANRALIRYQRVLRTIHSESKSATRAGIDRSITEVLADGHVIIEKLRGSMASFTGAAVVPPGLFPVATTGTSATFGTIEYTGGDTLLLQKFRNGIVTRFCDFKTFDQLIGSEDIQRLIQSEVVQQTVNFQQFKGSRPFSILFYGPPGTGKTAIAEAIARKMLPYKPFFVALTGTDVRNTGERGIKVLFSAARQLTKSTGHPVILFVDEFDQILSDTAVKSTVAAEMTRKTMSTVSGVPAQWDNANIIFLAATNYPVRIPESVMSSFTHKIYVGLPDLDQMRTLLMTKLWQIGWDRIDFGTRPVAGDSVDWFRSPQKHVRNLTKTNTVVDFALITDAVDDLALRMYQANYSHRDVMFLWDSVINAAEKRAIDFTVGPQAPLQTKIYFQKWLLEKASIEVAEQRGDECIKKQLGGYTYSYIPLWYTTVFKDGKGTPLQEEQVEATYMSTVTGNSRVGNVWGYLSSLTLGANPALTYTLYPKFQVKDKRKEVKVVVTRAEVTDATPVGDQLRLGIPSQPIIRVQVVRKQTQDVPAPATIGSALPFVPTRAESVSAEEQFSPLKVGPAQIRKEDFITLIRPVLIENLKDYDRTAARTPFTVISYGKPLSETIETNTALGGGSGESEASRTLGGVVLPEDKRALLERFELAFVRALENLDVPA